MPFVSANGIEIAYEDSGPKEGPVVLLVMGLGGQLIAWPPAFVKSLNDAGYRTLRFDNRDIGLSAKMEGKRMPNLMLHAVLSRIGLTFLAPYKLTDMAQDAMGLLDALSIKQVHVLGVSMGGMISQIIAAEFPQRVLSLTAVMTSTNHPSLPAARDDVMKTLLRPGTPNMTLNDTIEKSLDLWKLIATPGATTETELRARIAEALERSNYPKGPARQTAAIIGTGHLRRFTRKIKARTLVLHGDADPLVNIAGGKDIAAIVPGATFKTYAGMAHDMPDSYLAQLTSDVLEHLGQ